MYPYSTTPVWHAQLHLPYRTVRCGDVPLLKDRGRRFRTRQYDEMGSTALMRTAHCVPALPVEQAVARCAFVGNLVLGYIRTYVYVSEERGVTDRQTGKARREGPREKSTHSVAGWLAWMVYIGYLCNRSLVHDSSIPFVNHHIMSSSSASWSFDERGGLHGCMQHNQCNHSNHPNS
ncbi:hypothetical protein BC567DRAFT_57906 [Phyllosticta citribraziliensis]